MLFYLYMNVSGTWGIFHIVYFVISTVLLVVSLILIKKFVKNEKSKAILVKVFSAILLALIITNRIGNAIQRVNVEHLEGITWLYVFPETICGVCAFALSISLLFFKKDNGATNAVMYMAFAGGLASTFYPDFLNLQGLWELGTMTSVICHTVMLFLVCLVIILGYVKPSTRKWYYQPIAYMLMICYGLFYLNTLMPGIKDVLPVMNINLPLIRSQPILTSWWMLGIGYLAFEMGFLLIYDHFVNKKDFKVIGDEFIHFYRYINQKQK